MKKLLLLFLTATLLSINAHAATVTATVTMANQGWSGTSLYAANKEITWTTDEEINGNKLTFSTKATVSGNSSYPAYYNSAIRFYTTSNNKITAQVPEGYKVKAVVTTPIADFKVNGTAVDKDGRVAFNNPVTELTFEATTNKKELSKVVITLEDGEGGGDDPVDPDKEELPDSYQAQVVMTNQGWEAGKYVYTSANKYTAIWKAEKLIGYAPIPQFETSATSTGSTYLGYYTSAPAGLRFNKTSTNYNIVTVKAPEGYIFTGAKITSSGNIIVGGKELANNGEVTLATPTNFIELESAEDATVGLQTITLSLEKGTPKLPAPRVSLKSEGTYLIDSEVIFTSPANGAAMAYKLTADNDMEAVEQTVTLPFTYKFDKAGTYMFTGKLTAEGYDESDEFEYTYEIALPQLPTPTFSVPSETELKPGDKVTIESTVEGATALITINDEYVDEDDFVALPFTYTFTEEGEYAFEVIAMADGYNDSEEVKATYTVKAPTPVAPTVTFSVPEGTFKADAQFPVTLNVTGYPAPDVYYTVNGYKANGTTEHVVKYNPGDEIMVSAQHNNLTEHSAAMTLNVYATNTAGETHAAATYIFSNSVSQQWVALTSADQLTNGAQVVFVSTRFAKVMTGASGNGKNRQATSITDFSAPYNTIENLPEGAQIVTLEGNLEDGFKLRVDDTENGEPQYLNVSADRYLSTAKYDETKSAQYLAEISIMDADNTSDETYKKLPGRLTIVLKYNNTDYYLQFNGNTANNQIFQSATANPENQTDFANNKYSAVTFFVKRDVADEAHHELFLAMDENLWCAQGEQPKELAHPLHYEGDGQYTLNFEDIQPIDSEKLNGGIRGNFYIRCGKAQGTGLCLYPDHTQHALCLSTETPEPAQPEASARRRAQVATDNYVHFDPNQTYTLVQNPEGQAYLFGTDPAGKVQRVQAGTLKLQLGAAGTPATITVESPQTTGLQTLSPDGADATAPVQYFNLQGQPVANPTAPALYLKRQGGTTTKQLIK